MRGRHHDTRTLKRLVMQTCSIGRSAPSHAGVVYDFASSSRETLKWRLAAGGSSPLKANFVTIGVIKNYGLDWI